MHLHRHALAWSVLLALLAPAPAVGAECRPPAEDARVRVRLAPRAALAEVARWVSATLCKPVVFGGGVRPETPLTIVAPDELPVSAVEGLFADALVALDLRAVRGEQSIIVKPAASCAGYGATPPRPDLTRAAPPVDERELERGIRRRSDSDYELRRFVLDKVFADSRWLMRSARVVPYMRDGKPLGFKLYAIRPGSFFYRIGLQNGDAVHDLNGVALGSPEEALRAYSTLRKAKQVSLRLTRRGVPLVLRYRVVD